MNLLNGLIQQANININLNLKSLHNPEYLKNDETIRGIAQEVLQNGGIVHSHPLD